MTYFKNNTKGVESQKCACTSYDVLHYPCIKQFFLKSISISNHFTLKTNPSPAFNLNWSSFGF